MPSREGRAERYTDAMKLSFPLQFVFVIVSAFLTVAAGMYASTYSLRSEQSALRSDVRDVLTRLEYQAKIDDRDAKIQEERADAQRESMKEIRNRLELYKIELQQQIKDSAPPGRKSP